MKTRVLIAVFCALSLSSNAQWMNYGPTNDVKTTNPDGRVLTGWLPGIYPGQFNIGGATARPHIWLYGGQTISSANLLSKLNINLGASASLGVITSNTSGHGGMGMIEGPNMSSPMVWMYNFGSNKNAFTVAKVNYMASGISTIESNIVALLQVRENGNVGIGTTNPDAKLAVKGVIHAEEVKVDLTVPGPDYVFDKGYTLPTLKEVKAYIDQYRHLPEIPSATEIESDGIKVGEMNMLLLKKIEELTLYMIEQEKKMEGMQKQIDAIKK